MRLAILQEVVVLEKVDLESGIWLYHETLEMVRDFKHLGSIISEEGGMGVKMLESKVISSYMKNYKR